MNNGLAVRTKLMLQLKPDPLSGMGNESSGGRIRKATYSFRPDRRAEACLEISRVDEWFGQEPQAERMGYDGSSQRLRGDHWSGKTGDIHQRKFDSRTPWEG